ncbi:hypothetical protein GLIP_3850 [Aliiglaciecola lipolytica E3]|uniref:Secretin/TonB short N-terminal domain-containing protein n=2 Tax=Aliiglaciecola TaxID=1406885 RepID=K6XXT0_9ALTE|nr:hypothetical protein GLIP_3850 [Aliiglaciecola lipolytica E3]
MLFKHVIFSVFSLFFIIKPCIAEITDPIQFDIHAGNTANALKQLAEQADIMILYPYDLVSQKTSPAVKGNLSYEEAISRLLEGTNLIAINDNHGLFKVQSAATSVPVKETPDDVKVKDEPPDVLIAVDSHLEEEQTERIAIVGRLSNYQKRYLKKRYSNLIIESLNLQNNQRYIQRNVGNMLQSAAGASTDYRKREGLFLTVRGFGPELNTVLYNNRQLPSTNLGGGFSFDTLSSEMFTSSDVYKTQASELVSGGIGATINLVNLPTRGEDTYELSGGFRLSSSDDGGFFPEVFGSINYAGENIASIIAVDFLQQDYRIESANSDGWFAADLSGVETKSGSLDYTEIWVPRNFDLRIEESEKRRFGLSWVSRINLTPNLYVITDLVYSRFDVTSNIASSANWTHVNGSTANPDEKDTFGRITVDKNNTLLSYRYKPELSLASDYVQLVRNRPSEMAHFATALGYEFSLDSSVILDLSYTVAKSDNGGNKRFSAVGSPNANPEYTLLPNSPYANIDFKRSIDASDLRSHITIDSGDNLDDSIFQAKLDFQTILTHPNWEQIDIGIYFADRNKDKVAFRTPWGFEFGGYEFDVPDELFRPIDASNFLEGGVPETWYGFDSQRYIDYLWSDEHIQREIIDKGHPLADSIELRKQLGGFTATELPNSTWSVQERLFEAYFKTFSSGQLFELNWFAQMGVRWAATQIESRGFDQPIQDLLYSDVDPTALQIIYAQSNPVYASNKYANWLPNLSFKLELTDNQYLNLGLSKTISRPSLNKLAPAIGDFVARTGSSTANRGNPQLKPFESINLDMSWSWFFDENGLLDVTIYYKDIDNFILQSVEFEELLDHPEGEFLVSTPVNLNKTSFFGFEFVYQNQFESLPSPFDGTGIELRYTQVEAQSLEDNGALRGDVIEGLSNTYSFVLLYEKGAFNASLIYNHRDEFVRKQSGLLGQPEMVEGYGQFDVKFGYQINPQTRLFFDIQNLTQENPRSFSLYRERLLSYEKHQRIFTTGLRFSF